MNKSITERTVIEDVKKGDCIVEIDKSFCRIAKKEDSRIDGLAMTDISKNKVLRFLDINDMILNTDTL